MKKITCVLLTLMMLTMACGAFAEAIPSVTLGDIVVPVGGVSYSENFTISMTAIKPDTVEAVVYEEIATFVETEKVAAYFGEEVITTAQQYLPEELDVSTLVMDELFPLATEGYEAAYGDVEAVFEFVTTYEEGAVLLAMVGILPAEGEDAEIVWIPMPAEVFEGGKVKITFTQEALELLSENQAVLALLRAE